MRWGAYLTPGWAASSGSSDTGMEAMSAPARLEERRHFVQPRDALSVDGQRHPAFARGLPSQSDGGSGEELMLRNLAEQWPQVRKVAAKLGRPHRFGVGRLGRGSVRRQDGQQQREGEDKCKHNPGKLDAN